MAKVVSSVVVERKPRISGEVNIALSPEEALALRTLLAYSSSSAIMEHTLSSLWRSLKDVFPTYPEDLLKMSSISLGATFLRNVSTKDVETNYRNG